MPPIERETLIRQYADGQITWHESRERGFDTYVHVLAALGEFFLRPSVAPMEWPNVESRRRGRPVLK